MKKMEENKHFLAKNLQNPQKCGHICKKIQIYAQIFGKHNLFNVYLQAI